MKKVRIAFFDTKPYDRRFFDEANQKFDFELTYFESHLRPASAKLAEGFDVVCAFVNDDICKETIDALVAGNVRLLAMRCAGYNNVNLFAAHGRLPVVRVPGYSPYAVAEYALAMLQTLNRSLHRAYNRVRDNNFSINGFLGFDLRGKTIGIVGTGKIGMVFAEIMQGFGVRRLAYDLYPNVEMAKKYHIEYVTLDELYRQSDVISLHCPLTPENRYMINAESIAKMKHGVFIINTSRGKLIDTAALIEGLKSKKIGGAGLDVYEEESDLFFEDRSDAAIDDDILARLFTFPNVLVTSHQAFFTREAMTNISQVTLENIRAWRDGEKLVNEICSQCDGSRSCPGKPKDAPCCCGKN